MRPLVFEDPTDDEILSAAADSVRAAVERGGRPEWVVLGVGPDEAGDLLARFEAEILDPDRWVIHVDDSIRLERLR